MINEYRDSVKKVKGHRVHKVTNSIGMAEAFQYFRKYRKDISTSLFRRVIRLVNKELQNRLVSGEDIHFPHKMGYLELRKFHTKVEFIDGKLVTNLPIDWSKTIKLWYENKKAAERKQKVRIETPEIFRVIYKKSQANYNNKAFYEFSTNRELKLRLKEKIDNKEIDAFTFKGNI